MGKDFIAEQIISYPVLPITTDIKTRVHRAIWVIRSLLAEISKYRVFSAGFLNGKGYLCPNVVNDRDVYRYSLHANYHPAHAIIYIYRKSPNVERNRQSFTGWMLSSLNSFCWWEMLRQYPSCQYAIHISYIPYFLLFASIGSFS